MYVLDSIRSWGSSEFYSFLKHSTENYNSISELYSSITLIFNLKSSLFWERSIDNNWHRLIINSILLSL